MAQATAHQIVNLVLLAELGKAFSDRAGQFECIIPAVLLDENLGSPQWNHRGPRLARIQCGLLQSLQPCGRVCVSLQAKQCLGHPEYSAGVFNLWLLNSLAGFCRGGRASSH